MKISHNLPVSSLTRQTLSRRWSQTHSLHYHCQVKLSVVSFLLRTSVSCNSKTSRAKFISEKLCGILRRSEDEAATVHTGMEEPHSACRCACCVYTYFISLQLVFTYYILLQGAVFIFIPGLAPAPGWRRRASSVAWQEKTSGGWILFFSVTSFN